MTITQNVLINWYASIKKMRKIPMIFDWQNWLWKSKCGTFWRLVTAPILKIWYFFCERWNLGKNLLNFVPLPWKLDNPYCILLNCNVGKDKCPPNFVSKNNLSSCQRYTYRVLQTIQMKLIFWVWVEPAVLGSSKTALKLKYEILIG